MPSYALATHEKSEGTEGYTQKCMELADRTVSKTVGENRAGSSPAFCTTEKSLV